MVRLLGAGVITVGASYPLAEAAAAMAVFFLVLGAVELFVEAGDAALHFGGFIGGFTLEPGLFLTTARLGFTDGGLSPWNGLLE